MNMREIINVFEQNAGHGTVIRPAGWKAANDVPSSWTRPGHLYRGMSDAEYKATVATGRGLQSDSRYCATGEGTCFDKDAASAEGYVDFGHTDPRQTGKPNYVVEIENDRSGTRQDRDGYWKAKTVPQNRVRRVWRIEAEDDTLIAFLCRTDQATPK